MNGQFAEYEKAHRAVFKGDTKELDQFKYDYGYEVFKVCRSLSNSKYAKRRNIENRFGLIIASNNCLFVTLTFKDEVLEKTNEETRRKYVQRFLKSQCGNYVGNIDYGSKNEREHYHALVMTTDESNTLKIDEWKDNYGLIKVERVKTSLKDQAKVSKYVAKLSQHALKRTARLPRLIWSRGWKEFMNSQLDDRLLPF